MTRHELKNPPCLLPRRPAEGHKGIFGFALIIGGSRGMAGAISLAGMAALRGGAGLVRLAVPDMCVETVAGFEPSYMTVPLPCDADGRIIAAVDFLLNQDLEWATAVALGPGIGRSEELDRLVPSFYREIPRPLVVDADALNALASEGIPALPEDAPPRILTPHPGELARLLGGAKPLPEELGAIADAFAAEHRVTLILKGHQTRVTDGERVYINQTGNPGMGTGGSGDILTGVVTALLCQGLSPWDAARLGVYVHGRAGDLAAAELGQIGMIASDLVRFLPRALRECEEESDWGAK